MTNVAHANVEQLAWIHNGTQKNSKREHRPQIHITYVGYWLINKFEKNNQKLNEIKPEVKDSARCSHEEVRGEKSTTHISSQKWEVTILLYIRMDILYSMWYGYTHELHLRSLIYNRHSTKRHDFKGKRPIGSLKLGHPWNFFGPESHSLGLGSTYLWVHKFSFGKMWRTVKV